MILQHQLSGVREMDTIALNCGWSYVLFSHVSPSFSDVRAVDRVHEVPQVHYVNDAERGVVWEEVRPDLFSSSNLASRSIGTAAVGYL